MVARNRNISVKLDASLHEALVRRALDSGMTEDEAVRHAVERFVAESPAPDTSPADSNGDADLSVFDLLVRHGVAGLASGLPSDVSTNPEYMEGFGE